MIRYPIAEADLIGEVDAEDGNWRSEAALRLEAFRSAGTYDEELRIPDGSGGTKKASSTWSKVKPVYMRLQWEKCAYCERQLSSEEWGRGEHDLEHYRPKKKAKPWKVPAALRAEGVAVTAPLQGRSDPGYHLLSYHLFNYCASCKTCNSGLKRDEFPIEGPRDPAADDPALMQTEQPLLLYPIGDVDDDPETLIDFYGLSARAIPTDGRGRRRALVNIEFFELNNPSRKELYRERAAAITAVYGFLQNRRDDGDVWDELIAAYQSAERPHSSCVRSFVRLYDADEADAAEVFRAAADYYSSISTT